LPLKYCDISDTSIICIILLFFIFLKQSEAKHGAQESPEHQVFSSSSPRFVLGATQHQATQDSSDVKLF
jgi:hypothetical protein